jgi:heme/copper-type cytochrome/quinol oxidase subunit 2
MKTSTHKRIARLSGVLVLSLLVVALAVPTAQAMRDFSASVPSASAESGTSNSATRPMGWAWGFYYSDAGASRLLAMGAQPGHYVAFPASGTRPTLAQLQRAHDRGHSVASVGGTAGAAQSSGISSTTVWIASVAVLGAALIGAWALARRRRRQRQEAPACELSVAGC